MAATRTSDRVAALFAVFVVGCAAPSAGGSSTLAPTRVPTETPLGAFAAGIVTATPVPPTGPPTAEVTAVLVSPVESPAPPILLPAPSSTAAPAREPLDIPLFRQEHALSCEAAALRMALGALGIEATEEDVLARLPVDPTPRRVTDGGTVTWGDPDRGFVGQWDGVFARDGYGIYQEPIASVARSYGMEHATGVAGADPKDLYAAVADSTPVVVWMPYGGTVNGRGWWQTLEGKRIDYVVTEHAVVLAGLEGDRVRYADPYTGAFASLPRDQFEVALAELGNRAVLVRP